MTIAQIYKQYRLMPNLQLHQYRVAAVAQYICSHFESAVDERSITQACLLHDMGNIIKFDLASFPEFLEPEGLPYWEEVQESFMNRYGDDEFTATLQIAEEIGVSQRVLELIGQVNFNKIQANLNSEDLEAKICEYADTRVSPQGVVSLKERLDDLEVRYAARYPTPEDQIKRAHFRELISIVEKQIFDQITLEPSQITAEKVAPLIKSLPDFQLP